MKKENYKFKFEALSLTDFNMYIVLKADSKLIVSILEKSLEKKELKNKELNKEEILKITKFEVPKMYHNYLNTFLRSIIKDRMKYFKEKGINIIKANIDGAHFEKINSQWEITIKYNGKYIDHRV